MDTNLNTNGDTPRTLAPVGPGPWPALPLNEWQETYHNLHMWTQIIGKVRLALTPNTNHWWNVPLYVNARGLTTSPIPYGRFVFEVQFDFIDHKLLIDRSDGVRKTLELKPCTVSEFYLEFMSALRSLGISVTIYAKPVEVAGARDAPETHGHPRGDKTTDDERDDVHGDLFVNLATLTEAE